jgi:hypothetical protein
LEWVSLKFERLGASIATLNRHTFSVRVRVRVR